MTSLSSIQFITSSILTPLASFRTFSKKSAIPLTHEEIQTLWNNYQVDGEAAVYTCSELEDLLKKGRMVETMLCKVDELVIKLSAQLRTFEDSTSNDTDLSEGSSIEESIPSTGNIRFIPISTSIAATISLANSPRSKTTTLDNSSIALDIMFKSDRPSLTQMTKYVSSPSTTTKEIQKINYTTPPSPPPSLLPSPVSPISSNRTLPLLSLSNWQSISPSIASPSASPISLEDSITMTSAASLPSPPLASPSQMMNYLTCTSADKRNSVNDQHLFSRSTQGDLNHDLVADGHASTSSLKMIGRTPPFPSSRAGSSRDGSVVRKKKTKAQRYEAVIEIEVPSLRKKGKGKAKKSGIRKSKVEKEIEMARPGRRDAHRLSMLAEMDINSPSARLILPLRTYQFEGECGVSERQTCFLVLEDGELSIRNMERKSKRSITLIDFTRGGNEIVEVNLPGRNDIPLVISIRLGATDSRSSVPLNCAFDLGHSAWNRPMCAAICQRLRTMSEIESIECTSLSFGRQLEILIGLEESEDEDEAKVIFSNRYTFSFGVTAYGRAAPFPPANLGSQNDKYLLSILSAQYSSNLRYRLFYCDGLDIGGPSFYLESNDGASNQLTLPGQNISGIKICTVASSQVLVVELRSAVSLSAHFDKTVKSLHFRLDDEEAETCSAILRTIASRFEESTDQSFTEMTLDAEAALVDRFDQATRLFGSKNLPNFAQTLVEAPPSPTNYRTDFPTSLSSATKLAPFTLPKHLVKSLTVPLRMYRSGTGPDLENEIVSGVLPTSGRLDFILHSAGAHDPSKDIITIRYYDTRFDGFEDILVIKASDKSMRSILVPAIDDEAYVLCFTKSAELRVFQCGIDRSREDWDSKVFRQLVAQLSLWSGPTENISVETYSLRYQLSILTDIEETQQCPMNRRKVLHVPLKTFALGRRSSSLQSDSLSCSVYQIAESHGRPAEVVVYSATPGPIGRFSIAQQDITAVELPESQGSEASLMNLALIDNHTSAEFSEHFPNEEGADRKNLRLVIDPESPDFIAPEFQEMCRRFSDSWKSENVRVSPLSAESQRSLVASIRASLPQIVEEESQGSNKRRADSPDRDQDDEFSTSSKHARRSERAQNAPRYY